MFLALGMASLSLMINMQRQSTTHNDALGSNIYRQRIDLSPVASEISSLFHILLLSTVSEHLFQS